MTNHLDFEKIFPDAYTGPLQDPKGEDIDIPRKAHYLEMPAIIKRYGIWAITRRGIESLFSPYLVEASRLEEDDWIEHIKEKAWVSPECLNEFERALYVAKLLRDEGIIGR